MEVPKSIIHLVVGIVLASLLGLALQQWTSTSSAASIAKDINASQDTELAVIKNDIEHLKKASDWQMEAMRSLLRNEGLPVPAPK